jgi:hypothetical protein
MWSKAGSMCVCCSVHGGAGSCTPVHFPALTSLCTRGNQTALKLANSLEVRWLPCVLHAPCVCIYHAPGSLSGPPAGPKVPARQKVHALRLACSTQVFPGIPPTTDWLALGEVEIEV